MLVCIRALTCSLGTRPFSVLITERDEVCVCVGRPFASWFSGYVAPLTMLAFSFGKRLDFEDTYGTWSWFMFRFLQRLGFDH